MAWSPVPHPYQKYVNEDPNDYTSVDPNLIKAALAQAGLGDAAEGVFTNFQSMSSPGIAGKPSSGSAPSAPAGTPPVDYKSLIENDPFYQQAKADYTATGISNAAQRGQAIKKVFIDWGVLPDFTKTAAELGISQDAYDWLKADLADPNTAQYAATNEAQGLSRHARLDKANTQNIDSIRNALAARGMYQSGELGYGLTENAQQYKQASTDALSNILGTVQDVSNRYAAADQQGRRDLASAGVDAAGRVKDQVGTSGTTPSGTPSSQTATSNPQGTANFLLPAKTASVWDVNTASTNDAVNAAKASGGGIVIRPDDPEAVTKANVAAQAGVPVSIQVNGVGDDTPETLAARVKQYQTQFPGASFTLDLESPNYRDMTPGKMEAYAQSVQATAPNAPITITTEAVSDFNYAAWAKNPNVTFAPQCYWGDMTPRDVSQCVSLLVAQGVPIERIVPVVAPGQSLGSWTGPVSVYGAPTAGSQAAQPTGTTPYAALPSTPIGAAQANATSTSSTYSPETIQKINAIVADAYKNPDPYPTIKTGGMF